MTEYTLDNAPLESLDAFLDANAESLSYAEVKKIQALQPGEKITLGGGAAAEFKLARLNINQPPGGTCACCGNTLVCPHCE